LKGTAGNWPEIVGKVPPTIRKAMFRSPSRKLEKPYSGCEDRNRGEKN